MEDKFLRFFIIVIFSFGLFLQLVAAPDHNDENEINDESPERTPHVIVYDEDAYQRIKNRGDIVDFRGVNLIGADLEGLDLRNIILIDAKLNGARFGGADLTKALLNGANLESTQFDSSILIEADFKNNKYLIQTKFNGAKLNRAILNGSIINMVTFVEADLTEARIEDVEIIDSDFTKSILEKVSFEKSKIKTSKFIDIENARDLNLRYAEITDSLFENVDLSNSCLCDTTILCINDLMHFKQCNMTNVNFDNVSLSKVLFYNLYLDEAKNLNKAFKVNGCMFRYVSLTENDRYFFLSKGSEISGYMQMWIEPAICGVGHLFKDAAKELWDNKEELAKGFVEEVVVPPCKCIGGLIFYILTHQNIQRERYPFQDR